MVSEVCRQTQPLRIIFNRLEKNIGIYREYDKIYFFCNFFVVVKTTFRSPIVKLTILITKRFGECEKGVRTKLIKFICRKHYSLETWCEHWYGADSYVKKINKDAIF